MQKNQSSKDRLIKSLQLELKVAQENEQRLTTLIQSAPICIHEINLKGQITSMNITGLEMMDLQNEKDVCGVCYMDFVCEKQRLEINQLLERAYQGEYNAFEFSPEGSELIFSSCFAPVINKLGAVEKIMGITENITAQRNHQKDLLESETKFRNLFENADISIWNEDMSDLKHSLDQLRTAGVTDLKQYLADHPKKVLEYANLIKVVNVNKATLDMFNAWSEKSFIEHIPKSFGPDADSVFIKELCAIWDSEKTFRSEATYISQAGEKIDTIISFHIPASPEGFKSVAVSIVNNTVQKQVEKERLKSRKLESLGLLADGIAHDFNNILTGLFGNLELAKLKLSSDHDAYQHVKTANLAMDRATALATQLLTFAKGGDPLFEAVDIAQVIQDSIELSLSGSNIRSILKLQQDLWVLNADKGQLSQVITNLLINASHAMPRGGTLTIEAINIEEDTNHIIPNISGGFVCIKIIDEGVGISEEQQKYIFDPYFTTKKSGSGLGLATAHSIITKHNGYISVESELDKGTTFSIYLPANSDEQSADKLTLNNTGKTVQNSGKILVMDDEEMILDISTKLLELLGYSVETAADGKQAIERYIDADKCGDPFDVVIMDLTIPGGEGGEEVIKELLKINPLAKTIVSSGYSSGKVMSNYTEYGFNGRLVKPFLMKDLENYFFYKILLDEVETN
jgi:PAS domain S-box-containing protein